MSGLRGQCPDYTEQLRASFLQRVAWVTFEATVHKTKSMWTRSSFILGVDAPNVGTTVEGLVGAKRRQDWSGKPSVVDTASELNVIPVNIAMERCLCVLLTALQAGNIAPNLVNLCYCDRKPNFRVRPTSRAHPHRSIPHCISWCRGTNPRCIFARVAGGLSSERVVPHDTCFCLVRIRIQRERTCIFRTHDQLLSHGLDLPGGTSFVLVCPETLGWPTACATFGQSLVSAGSAGFRRKFLSCGEKISISLLTHKVQLFLLGLQWPAASSAT